MPRSDRRGAAFICLLLLAGCSATAPPRIQSTPIAGPAAACSTSPAGGSTASPAGGPLQADRGIGGTGAPQVVADRGIGGTGIVGTGIVGLITGFASVCIAGHEVAYDPALPVTIDGRPAAAAALRAGQVAAIEASGPDTALTARRVAIRHEVEGPLETQDAPGLMRVAGQRVAFAASTLGDSALQPGEWVAVSGLRDPDGLIHATRLDRIPASSLKLRGLLLREGHNWRIGALEIRFAQTLRPLSNTLVLVEGHYAGGVLYADSLEPDPWNPGASGVPLLFGPEIQVIVIETFAGYADGRLVIGRTRRERGTPDVQQSVVEFERRRDGSLQPARVQTLAPARATPGTPSPGAATPGAGTVTRAADRHFEPAPVPTPVPARDADLGRSRPDTRSSSQPSRAGPHGADSDRSGPTGIDPQTAPSIGPSSGPPAGFPGRAR